jgi:hypothetical protein
MVASLGLRTDLMLIGWDGVIDEVDGAVRARSPANPSFFFGNFLLFPDAPKAGHDWVARYASAFPDRKRVCLRWDRPDGERGELAELIADGFTIEETIVMQTSTPRAPPRITPGVALRRIESDADWAAVTALQAATMSESWPGGAEFARAQMARYRPFVAAGRGAWFGAFDGDELVADMGVFVEGGVARFQAVETSRAHRRRGLCGTLAHHAACVALAELDAKTLVMVGLPDHTAHVYATVGFEPCERLVAAFRA